MRSWREFQKIRAMGKQSENRRIKRLLLRRGTSKDKEQVYTDNVGVLYEYKVLAKLSSLHNIFWGCMKNGFPISVRYLWYNAWAFYPFFFIRSEMRTNDVLAVLNHERIHIRQQRDIWMFSGIPFAIIVIVGHFMSGLSLWNLLWIIMFPTIFYMIDFCRAFVVLKKLLRKGLRKDPITIQVVRENTCFELEATSKAKNFEYLKDRRAFSHLEYKIYGN